MQCRARTIKTNVCLVIYSNFLIIVDISQAFYVIFPCLTAVYIYVWFYCRTFHAECI